MKHSAGESTISGFDAEVHQRQIARAEEAVQLRKDRIRESPLRQKYHFMPEAGWINDPNGLIFFRGKYHYFYQYNPFASTWGPMHWGHAVSADLLHWEYLPVALAPSESYDFGPRGGCFSGSSIEHNGSLFLFYTGTTMREDRFVQTQCLASSTDGVHFVKHGNNPVLCAPTGFDPENFRDPKVWKHNDSFYMICGARKGERGQALIFRSADLLSWEYLNVFAESRGEFGYMWECPDVFSLGGKDVLTFSPMGVGERKTIYLIGDIDYGSGKFHYTRIGEADWGFDYYAPQSLIDDRGRRIVVGWSNSWPWMPWWEDWGLTGEEGWCGFYGIPREVRLEENDMLSFHPVEEMKSLRHTPLLLEDIAISEQPFAIKPDDPVSFEMLFRVDLEKTTAESFTVCLRGKNQKGTWLSFDLKKSEACFNRNWSGHNSGRSRALLQLNGRKYLDVHVFVDRISVEVFTNNYQTAISGNIFPDADQTENFLTAHNGTLRLHSFGAWTLAASMQK